MASLNLIQHKVEILLPYGTESLRDLDASQLADLSNRLQQIQDSHADGQQCQVPVAIRRLRSNVLSVLTDMKIYDGSKSWDRVNNFLLNPRIAGKLLYEMGDEELKALNKKLRAMHKKNEEMRQRENYIARQN